MGLCFRGINHEFHELREFRIQQYKGCYRPAAVG